MNDLIISPWRATDADAMFTALADERIYQFIPEVPPRSPAALAERHGGEADPAADGLGRITRTYTLRERGAVIGLLEITIEPSRTVASLGYKLSPDYWGRGLATTALENFVEQLQTECGHLKMLRAAVDSRNHASMKVLSRNSFIEVSREDGMLKRAASTNVIFERTLP